MPLHRRAAACSPGQAAPGGRCVDPHWRVIWATHFSYNLVAQTASVESVNVGFELFPLLKTPLQKDHTIKIKTVKYSRVAGQGCLIRL